MYGKNTVLFCLFGEMLEYFKVQFCAKINPTKTNIFNNVQHFQATYSTANKNMSNNEKATLMHNVPERNTES